MLCHFYFPCWVTDRSRPDKPSPLSVQVAAARKQEIQQQGASLRLRESEATSDEISWASPIVLMYTGCDTDFFFSPWGWWWWKRNHHLPDWFNYQTMWWWQHLAPMWQLVSFPVILTSHWYLASFYDVSPVWSELTSLLFLELPEDMSTYFIFVPSVVGVSK